MCSFLRLLDKDNNNNMNKFMFTNASFCIDFIFNMSHQNL